MTRLGSLALLSGASISALIAWPVHGAHQQHAGNRSVISLDDLGAQADDENDSNDLERWLDDWCANLRIGLDTGVWPRGGWPDDTTAATFEGVIGLTLPQVAHCASAAQLAGAEVLLVTSAHAEAP